MGSLFCYCGTILVLYAAIVSSASSSSNANLITINLSADSTSDAESHSTDAFDPTIPVDYFPARPSGFVLRNDSNASYPDPDDSKRDNSIQYHGGSLLGGTTNTYVIWYGNWVDNPSNQQIRSILINFLTNVGSSQWFQINSNYVNGGVNTRFVNDIGYGTSTYTYGSILKGQHIYNIVRDSLSSNQLATDTNGLYYVFTSPDIQQYDDPTYGFCTNSAGKIGYCGWHSYGMINSKSIKYSFIGSTANCNYCEAQKLSPNGNWVADSMVSIIGHELSETITDPEFVGWFDSNSEENADKCAWQFGQTSMANGYQFNVQFGGRNWLLQQLWKVSGGCALSP